MFHHRRSVRLPDFGYAGGFAYLVTICTRNRHARFGDIADGIVHLSADGRIAEQHWLDLPSHFPQVGIDAYAVQPDHLHGILWIEPPLNPGRRAGVQAQHAAGAQRTVPPPLPPPDSVPPRCFGHLVPGTLPVVIRAYKAAVSRTLTREHGPVWQRGYHESVLRTSGQLERARQYVGGHLVARP